MPEKNKGGRPKGAPNKQTRAVKQCILNAFEDIGGVANLAAWAEANQTDFYTKMWVKVMPTEITGEDGGDITVTINKIVHSARDSS